MSGQLRITLVRSLSGRNRYQRAVVQGLGLTRLHRPVLRKDSPEIRGMVRKVGHLLRVEEVGEGGETQ
ncbi:MAG: 50S ribosomal protein L30 [Deltaproteobacteria bacterium]